MLWRRVVRGDWFCVRRPGLAGASSGLGAELENQRAVCHVHPVPGLVWRLAFLCRVLSSPGPDYPRRVLFQR